jgi:DNA invertase Pin-like site-specific DNA recombinase
MKKAVLYFRVSTKKQILGMDAQRRFIDEFLANSDMTVARIYIEKESGKRIRRPELKRAVRYSKMIGATLVFSTMSRLSRDALLVADLMLKKVDFIAADKPNARPLEHLEDAIRAQREVEDISKRTRDALQEAKAQGVELGKNGKVLAERNKRLADEFAQTKGSMIEQLHDAGYSYQAIADKWNAEGPEPFREGCRWHASTVYTTWKRSIGLVVEAVP